MSYADDLPSVEELLLLTAAISEAGLAEESWRRWGVVEFDGPRVDTAARLREQDRVRTLFRQEVRP